METCSLDKLTGQNSCGKKGGMRAAYWTTYAEIDWVTMAGDPTKFTTANKEILEYVMEAGGSFKKLEFNKKSAFYDFDYTKDTSVGTPIVTGKHPTRS